MSKELKPCKSCGKIPVRTSFVLGRHSMTWIKCQECGKSSDGKFSLNKAIEAWNALFEQQASKGGL